VCSWWMPAVCAIVVAPAMSGACIRPTSGTAGRLAEVTVTDEHTGEELSWMSSLREGDIVVADNGYGYRRSVAVVVGQGAHLVTDVTPSTFPVQTRAARAHRGAGVVAAGHY
jgi:hypothetical protein